MAEEPKEATPAHCDKMACVLNWLKAVDDWTVAGYKNKLPRMYYVVGGLAILFILL